MPPSWPGNFHFFLLKAGYPERGAMLEPACQENSATWRSPAACMPYGEGDARGPELSDMNEKLSWRWILQYVQQRQEPNSTLSKYLTHKFMTKVE